MDIMRTMAGGHDGIPSTALFNDGFKSKMMSAGMDGGANPLSLLGKMFGAHGSEGGNAEGAASGILSRLFPSHHQSSAPSGLGSFVD